MPGRDVIVVGASAGGVETLVRLVGGLPPDLPASLFVVLHIPPDLPSHLPDILSRAGPLPAAHAKDGGVVQHGRIYVAPPNHHLFLDRGKMRLVVGPRENGVRPAADVLFRSAARSYGSRVVGVVLSGMLSDGALGLTAIKMAGGLAVVQDPDEAVHGSMPARALEVADVDHCARVAEISVLLNRLAREPIGGERGGVSVGIEDAGGTYELDGDRVELAGKKRNGEASGLTCPECHGSLWELKDGPSVRLECRIGHAYSLESFLREQGESVENALWAAINTLSERASMLRRLSVSATLAPGLAARYEERAQETKRQAEVVREVLLRLVQTSEAN